MPDYSINEETLSTIEDDPLAQLIMKHIFAKYAGFGKRECLCEHQAAHMPGWSQHVANEIRKEFKIDIR